MLDMARVSKHRRICIFFMKAYLYVRTYKDRFDINIRMSNDPYIFGHFYRNSKPAPMLLFRRAPRNETKD